MLRFEEERCLREMTSILFLESFFYGLKDKRISKRECLKHFNRYDLEKEECFQILGAANEQSILPELHGIEWPRREAETLFKEGVRVSYAAHSTWPKRLEAISDPPSWLWYQGASPNSYEDSSPIAIVGSRCPDEYSMHVCEDVVRYLVAKGHALISGLALGMDSLVHRNCLSEGGVTMAILPCGISDCYPKSNLQLKKDITVRGFVASEFPPNYPIRKLNFHSRNRIISALAEEVVVIQAAERSGTCITASKAMEQGRTLHVVPGSFYMSSYKGSQQIVNDGAFLLGSMQDLERIKEPEIAVQKLEVSKKKDIKQDFHDERFDLKVENLLRFIHFKEPSMEELKEKFSQDQNKVRKLMVQAEMESLFRRRKGRLFLTAKGLSCIYER